MDVCWQGITYSFIQKSSTLWVQVWSLWPITKPVFTYILSIVKRADQRTEQPTNSNTNSKQNRSRKPNSIPKYIFLCKYRICCNISVTARTMYRIEFPICSGPGRERAACKSRSLTPVITGLYSIKSSSEACTTDFRAYCTLVECSDTDSCTLVGGGQALLQRMLTQEQSGMH